jgi:asparagine synthetase A
MTPKEKAKELIQKYLRLEDDTMFYWEPYYDRRCWDNEVLIHAKKCALICVNEIYSGIYNYLKDTDELQNADREFAYWNNVEKEIKNYE